jgi:glycosyltransferase involved in cell wall biosynthesis
LISIIIPNYNRKKTLLKAISSCLNQTYKSVEIIIVDDNSNFNLESYIQKKFPKSYNNKLIKIFTNKKNLGAAKSRNIGFNKSKGNYISFLDSDDYWATTKLAKQINRFYKNKKLDLVYCDQYLITGKQKKKSNKKMIKSNILNELINGWTAPNTSTLMYSRKAFKRIGGFNENLKSCQDHDLWFRVAKKNFNVDFINEPLSYFVMDSPKRISYDLDNRMNGVVSFLENIKNYIPLKKYKLFKNRYIIDACLPIFKKELQKKNYLQVIKILFKYFFFNSYFYPKIINIVHRKLRYF